MKFGETQTPKKYIYINLQKCLYRKKIIVFVGEPYPRESQNTWTKLLISFRKAEESLTDHHQGENDKGTLIHKL